MEDIEADIGTSKPARKKQKKEMTEWEKQYDERRGKIQEEMFEEAKKRAMEGAPPLEWEEPVEGQAEGLPGVERDGTPAVKEKKARPMGKKKVRAMEQELAKAERQEKTRAVRQTSVPQEHADLLLNLLERDEGGAVGDSSGER